MKNGQRNFDLGKRYEYRVMDFLVRRKIPIQKIQRFDSPNSHFTDNYDLDIPEYDLKLEVKGSQVEVITFWKSSYSKEVNIYAFYFYDKDLILFLTKNEFLDIVGRNNLKGNHTKIIHLKFQDIYDKALNLKEIYNY